MRNQRIGDIYFVVITRQSDPSISKFSRPCSEFKWVSGQYSHTIHYQRQV